MSTLAGIKRRVKSAAGLAAPALWKLYPAPQLLICTYHRVLPHDHPETRVEQPGMWVTPETLDLHCHVLMANFEPVDLTEWIEKRASGAGLPDRAVAFTFDDGWHDNLEFAHPVLFRHRMRATIFVVSSFCDGRGQYWPNVLARWLADPDSMNAATGPRNPETLQLIDFLKQALPPQDVAHGRLSPDSLDRAIVACKARYSDTEMKSILAATLPASQQTHSHTLTWPELAEMKASGIWRIGSHSYSHTRLGPQTSARTIHEEIARAHADISLYLNEPPKLFCFPNGDFSAESVTVCKRHHLGAVTTETGWNSRNSDSFRLARVSLHESMSSTKALLQATISPFLNFA